MLRPLFPPLPPTLPAEILRARRRRTQAFAATNAGHRSLNHRMTSRRRMRSVHMDSRQLNSLISRMQTGQRKQPPKIHHFLLVHVERGNCRTPCWGQPNNERKVITPREMLLPVLLPWVEESYQCQIQGINAFSLVVFVAIARGARKREVRHVGSATFRAWHNMLHGKRARHKAVRCVTVFTPPSRARMHGPPPRRGHALKSHVVEYRWPIVPSVARARHTAGVRVQGGHEFCHSRGG